MLGKLIRSLSVFLLLGYAGCAGLTHHRNQAALVKIKKVAVVGFAVREPEAPGFTNPETKKEVEQMYSSLTKSFNKEMNWQVVPIGVMRQNAAYQTAYEKTMKGWQNKMPMNKGQKQLLVEGICDNDCLRILGKDGRAALIQGLGVDAVITAELDVTLSGTTVMGIGNRYPQTRLSFMLFTPGTNSPDWFEGNIQGEPSATSVGKTAFIDEALMNRLALESAHTAYAKIGKEK